MTDGFSMLFVCHANLCRSPMAERLARHAFTERFGADGEPCRVTSAGTHAFVGSDMHRSTARVLAELGVDAAGFASRQLTARLVADADLVLTADRQQRAAAVTMVPAAMRYTFTLRQFGRMAAALGEPGESAGAASTAAGHLRALLDQVVRGRSRLQPVDPALDDLADPVGRPVEAFRVCAQEIQRELAAITGVIAAR